MNKRPKSKNLTQASFMGDGGVNECHVALLPWEAGGTGW